MKDQPHVLSEQVNWKDGTIHYYVDKGKYPARRQNCYLSECWDYPTFKSARGAAYGKAVAAKRRYGTSQIGSAM